MDNQLIDCFLVEEIINKLELLKKEPLENTEEYINDIIYELSKVLDSDK